MRRRAIAHTHRSTCSLAFDKSHGGWLPSVANAAEVQSADFQADLSDSPQGALRRLAVFLPAHLPLAG